VLFPEPLSERIVHYAVDVGLDEEAHRLEGHERVRWRNTTADAVNHAWFHLYMNAFSSSETVFMRESGGRLRGSFFDDESWGYCHVSDIRLLKEGGHRVLEPGYPGPDRTTMRVELGEAVPPGGEAVFDIDFEVQLPRVFARAGYAGNFHMAGQWFPKLGVYREGRGWHCHSYHASSEFFADFGVFDVEITVPEDMVVGATGVEWRRRRAADTITISYHAEDVHDFAWTASPRFQDVPVDIRMGSRTITMRFLMDPGNMGHLERYRSSLEGAIRWLDEKLGPYPYSQITVVDPPAGGWGAFGMEYPTLICAGTHPLAFEGVRLAETVVIHEFTHNYWYGMSASDEFEEAWLDEGFTSYYEHRILEALYGRATSALETPIGLNVSMNSLSHESYRNLPDRDPVVTKSWEFSSPGAYGTTVYDKAALALRTLEGLLGRERADAVFRSLFQRVAFTHPDTETVLRILDEESGGELGPYLRPLFYGTGTVDYLVSRVRTRMPPRHEGYDLSGEEPLLLGAGEASEKREGDTSRRTEIIVQREGSLVLPVEILVEFEGGGRVLERWNGRERWVRFVYEGARVERVTVDPDRRIALDLDPMNNGWMRRADPRPASSLGLRFRVFFQGLLALLMEGV